jgi:hypothetical protein
MKKLLGAIVAVVVAVAALGALIHFVLVWDGLAPHSNLGGYFSVAQWNTLDLSHIDEWNKAAKDNYGPRSSTALRGSTWEAYVEGKVVERKPIQASNSSAYGLFMVAERDSFPFEVSIDPKHITDQEFTTDNIKRKMAGTMPAKALDFDAQDWRIAYCHSPDAPDFGFFRSVLRLGPADVCLIRLKAEGSGTLVIGYAVVYGEPWTQPMSKRICRTLSESWVNSMMSRPNVERPDFAGCLLINRTGGEQQASAGAVSAHFFEVRDDKSLAVFD